MDIDTKMLRQLVREHIAKVSALEDQIAIYEDADKGSSSGSPYRVFEAIGAAHNSATRILSAGQKAAFDYLTNPMAGFRGREAKDYE
jgi:hypothetical protein